MQLSNEQVLRHAIDLSTRAVKEMGIEGGEWLIGRCDLLDPERAMEFLLDRTSPIIIVAGDWRNNKNDIYDVVIRFAEDHFGRIRHKKYPVGTYVVVMSERLTTSGMSQDI